MSRKSGQSYPINDQWREMVDSKIRERGWTRAEFAARIPCAASVITQLLNGDSDETPLAPRIHFLLDLTPPHMAILDEPTQTLVDKFRTLSDTDKARILERVDMLAGGPIERPAKQPNQPQRPKPGAKKR